MRKDIKKELFFEDDDPQEEDLTLLNRQPKEGESIPEKKFWEEMKKKVLGEFAPSGDLLLSEHDNEDEIYLVRYYFHEFRIGRGTVNERTREAIYTDSFAEALEADMFPLIDRHISLFDWLKQRDFKNIDYEGNYAMH